MFGLGRGWNYVFRLWAIFVNLILLLVSNVGLVESSGLLVDHPPILKDLFEPDVSGCLERIKREKSAAELRGLLSQVDLLCSRTLWLSVCDHLICRQFVTRFVGLSP